MNDNEKDILRRQKKPMSRPVKFFLTMAVTLGVFLVGFAVIIGVTLTRGAGSTFATFDGDVMAIAKSIQSNLKGASEEKKGNIITDMFQTLPERVNIAVFGVDEDGTRTDVIMVAALNTKTSDMSLISVPRDTYIVMPEDMRQALRDAGRKPPSSGVMKINAVSAYSGREYAMPFAVKELESILNITIEYYVRVDLNAFRYIVDEVGGVTFDVPQRMYYRDPGQGLYIDLQAGLQTLDGKQAEGLVRYRKADKDNPISKDLPRGDIDRAEIQRNFVKAFLK